MKGKVIVFVTGCPGCGKTTFTSRILQRFPDLVLSSYDRLKDEYFDRYGFDSLQERDVLNAKSLAKYYEDLDALMRTGASIITDYPFNRLVHETSLKDLVSRNGYSALSITLYGDPAVLRERGTLRDLSDKSRNFGHLLTRYHKGDYSEADRIPVMDLETFIRTIDRKDYFLEIGQTLRVDVTDFSKVDYDNVLDAVSAILL